MGELRNRDGLPAYARTDGSDPGDECDHEQTLRRGRQVSHRATLAVLQSMRLGSSRPQAEVPESESPQTLFSE